MKLQKLLALLAMLVVGAPALAQEQVIGADPAPAATSAWASACSSSARSGPANCQLSQRAISSQTRRMLAAVTIQLPAGEQSSLVIATSVGVSLPAGVSFDIDGAGKQALAFTVCDTNGCYASTPLAAETLAAMQGGQKLNVSMQDLNKQVVTVPMTLVGFTAAYDNVK